MCISINGTPRLPSLVTSLKIKQYKLWAMKSPDMENFLSFPCLSRPPYEHVYRPPSPQATWLKSNCRKDWDPFSWPVTAIWLCSWVTLNSWPHSMVSLSPFLNRYNIGRFDWNPANSMIIHVGSTIVFPSAWHRICRPVSPTKALSLLMSRTTSTSAWLVIIRISYFT